MNSRQSHLVEVPRYVEGCYRLDTLIDHGLAILDLHQSLFSNGFTTVDDKWLLSSAVQKLIRRGDTQRLVSNVIALNEIDPAYLPRRLPVIAVEDVGLGNLELVNGVLTHLASKRLSTKLSSNQKLCVLVSLADRLASAIKSRAACDLFCLAMASDTPCNQLQNYFSLPTAELVKIAVDRSADLQSRCFAFYVLSGVTRVVNGRHQAVSKFSMSALQECAELLQAPSIIQSILSNGRNTLGLSSMLPLAYELIEAPQDEIRIIFEDFSGGCSTTCFGVSTLPLMAVDQYTRLGKKVFSSTLENNAKLLRILDGAPKSKQSAIVGMAVFHVEGWLLDKRRTNDRLELLRLDVERRELLALGLDERAHEPLYEYLHNTTNLNQRRSELLSSSQQAT